MRIKVKVEFNEIYGLVVTDIKGIKSGAEMLMREIEKALRFTVDGYITVDWSETEVPVELRRYVVVSQAM